MSDAFQLARAGRNINGCAKRLRGSDEVSSDMMTMEIVVCDECGVRFGIGHHYTSQDVALAARQARWLIQQLTWDHIREAKHHQSVALPDLSAADAEDLAQETWVRVLQRGCRYNGRQGFDPWLFAVARNLAIDYLRRTRKSVEAASLPDDPDAMLLFPSSGPSPFETAARSEDAMRLAGRLQILPPLYREALLLRFQEDLSLAEIAEVLGAPVTTVTSRIYRGLEALRSAFEEGGDSPGV